MESDAGTLLNEKSFESVVLYPAKKIEARLIGHCSEGVGQMGCEADIYLLTGGSVDVSTVQLPEYCSQEALYPFGYKEEIITAQSTEYSE